jgi:hypothetical protein
MAASVWQNISSYFLLYIELRMEIFVLINNITGFVFTIMKFWLWGFIIVKVIKVLIYLHISTHRVPYFANNKTRWAILCTKITQGKCREKIFYCHFKISWQTCWMKWQSVWWKHQKLDELIHIAHSTEFEMQFPPSSSHEFVTLQNLFCRPTLLVSFVQFWFEYTCLIHASI